MEGNNGLKVLSLTTPDLARQMESAIQFGKPVLLQDVLEGKAPAGTADTHACMSGQCS
jgi:hypothetical protein